MPARLKAIAEELYAARDTLVPVPPITARHDNLTVDDAYAIQTVGGDMRLARGERIVGYKVGLTSESVQQQLGVNEPDFGLLFASMEVAPNQILDTSQLISPKAEGEIGFVFNRDIEHADITLTELKSAIDYFFPVIEIVDSAIANWKITLIDTVADNASSALYMPGNSWFDPRGIDFASLEVNIRSGDDEVSGCGSACLGNPLYSTLWLVRKMVSLGRPIRRGQVVLSGALAPMVTLQSGMSVEFEFKGLETLVLNTA